MSVTFRLNNATYYPVPNLSYNPEEPEDDIYNPKTISETIYPEMNISNINAGSLLITIDKYDQQLCGEIENKDLDAFIDKINKLELSDTTPAYLIKYLVMLDRISRIAKELGDALRRKTLLIFGDTDNEGIKNSLSKIKSIL